MSDTEKTPEETQLDRIEKKLNTNQRRMNILFFFIMWIQIAATQTCQAVTSGGV